MRPECTQVPRPRPLDGAVQPVFAGSTHRRRRVTLSAVRDERGNPAIRIADNGPGIEPEHLENIFVPFFTMKRHGTGVGLSVSRQIMFRNRGLITVQSAPGRGLGILAPVPLAPLDPLAAARRGRAGAHTNRAVRHERRGFRRPPPGRAPGPPGAARPPAC